MGGGASAVRDGTSGHNRCAVKTASQPSLCCRHKLPGATYAHVGWKACAMEVCMAPMCSCAV